MIENAKLKLRMLIFRIFCCFSDRGEKVSMGHVKKNEIGRVNDKMSVCGGGEPNLLWGRTSFSGSTVPGLDSSVGVYGGL